MSRLIRYEITVEVPDSQVIDAKRVGEYLFGWTRGEHRVIRDDGEVATVFVVRLGKGVEHVGD